MFQISPRLTRRLCFLEAYPISHLLSFRLECLKMTMLTSQLFLFLALPFLASVYADYVVYPRIRNNIRLNAAITDSISFFLGAENVQTFVSRPRQVYEFWLIKATDTQAGVVRGITGVSLLCQYWLGLTGLLMLDIRS